MTRQLRVAVIGVGEFGEQHLAAYRRQPGVEVVAVADANPRRAEAVAEKWGVHLWFKDGSELIEACSPTAVSIVTPTQHHHAPTLAALGQGCAVLLEKPVAMSTSEAVSLMEAEAMSNGFVVPAHILRFALPYSAVQSHVASGSLGKLLGISSRRERPRSHERMFPGMHPVLLSMVHDIDLALWISGSRALRVSAHSRGAEDGGPPLLVWAHVEAADGSVWSLHTSWVLPDDLTIPDRLEVYGSEGAVVLNLQPHVQFAGRNAPVLTDSSDPLADAIVNEIAQFCAYVREPTRVRIVNLADAIHGLEIADAIISSADNNGIPTNVINHAAR